MPKNIRGKVGAGALNRFEDVRTVQYLLNCVPSRAGGPIKELRVDGTAGPKTLAAVERFVWRCGGSGPFTPRGAALRALHRFDPYPQMKMPPVAPGPGDWAKERRLTTEQAAAVAVVEALAYAEGRRGRMQAYELMRLEPLLERAAATVMEIAKRRKGEELGDIARAMVAAVGADAAEWFGYPKGPLGASLLSARIAEAARSGAKRTEWLGQPGGGWDPLWRGVQEWLETRSWRIGA